jgi:hypothetical protein
MARWRASDCNQTMASYLILQWHQTGLLGLTVRNNNSGQMRLMMIWGGASWANGLEWNGVVGSALVSEGALGGVGGVGG